MHRKSLNREDFAPQHLLDVGDRPRCLKHWGPTREDTQPLLRRIQELLNVGNNSRYEVSN